MYEKLKDDLEIVYRVLMALVTEGHGELRYYFPVILDDKVVIVIVISMVRSILATAVWLRIYDPIIFTFLLVV